MQMDVIPDHRTDQRSRGCTGPLMNSGGWLRVARYPCLESSIAANTIQSSFSCPDGPIKLSHCTKVNLSDGFHILIFLSRSQASKQFTVHKVYFTAFISCQLLSIRSNSVGLKGTPGNRLLILPLPHLLLSSDS